MITKVIIKEQSFIAKIAALKLKQQAMAITIGHTIYLHNVSREHFLSNKSWLCHELKHVQQFQQYGFFSFIFRYLLESFNKGYHFNKYEVEARAAETASGLLNRFEII